jgi:tellurite resistance protein
MFGSLKKVLGAGVAEARAGYAENRDFLEAVCSGVALVANADGNIDDGERRKAVSLLTGHSTLSKLYKTADIESCLTTMFGRAKDSSGRQQLARELDDISGRPNAAQMAEDVYLIALDIAGSDGSVGDDEKSMLQKIAHRIGVDTAKFDFA